MKPIIALLLLCSVSMAGNLLQPTGRYAVKPLTFGAVPYYLDGRNTPDDHLINSHGFTTNQLKGLNSHQKNLLHGAAHAAKPVTSQQTCPNGVCPLRRR